MERQYRTLSEVPNWARETVRYLLAKNYLRRTVRPVRMCL